MTDKTIADRRKIAAADFVRMKHNQRIVMITAYDYPTARIADGLGIDSILVGDSYGMVVLGNDTTIPVTVDELLPVCRAVRRGSPRALLIADMPFLSFQVSDEDALRNAGRFVKEGGMQAVKLEGGAPMVPRVEAIVRAGIPVLGHIGVTPQSSILQTGYVVQGNDAETAKRLVEDAESLEKAGVFGIVLEMVTEEVATLITETVSIPTIGIGSGRHCDGQVLVLHDILGLYPRFTPRFAKRFADVSVIIKDALRKYCEEVRSGAFPGEEHSFKMEEGERSKLRLRRKTG